MIYQTLTKSQFIDAFKQSDTRKNQFTYEALGALYDYLEESSNGEMYEFDMVAICCDWQEATWQEVADQYRLDLSEHDTEVDKIRAVSEYLWEETHSIDLDDGNFLFVNF
jgi:hypothetical protein